MIMPTRCDVPRSDLEDLLLGQFPDGPDVTVTILTFYLVHFNVSSAFEGKL